ncbi:hypothetical protein HZA97_08875 [Candidatus Woesearchaeota archaeon]|nr:hypothetical protein [Candidatus Woesearchaeota archaeon]
MTFIPKDKVDEFLSGKIDEEETRQRRARSPLFGNEGRVYSPAPDLWGSVTRDEARTEAEKLSNLFGSCLESANLKYLYRDLLRSQIGIDIQRCLEEIKGLDMAEEVCVLARRQDPSLSQFPIFKPWAEAQMYLMPESATREHVQCLLGIIPPDVGTKLQERESGDW